MTKLILNTDGGARGNPGPAGVGVTVTDEQGRVVAEASKFLGVATNNEAEYQAALLGLVTIKNLPGGDLSADWEIEHRLDSELVVKQLRGEYKIKEARLRDWADQVKALAAAFKRVSWVHVRREQNARADELANEAMDQGLGTASASV